MFRGFRGGLAGMMVLLSVALAGCGISEEQFEKVSEERDALKAQVKQLVDDLDKAKAELAVAKTKADKQVKPNRPSEAVVANALAQLKLDGNTKLIATLKTTMGDIRCQLMPDVAPETVLNFVGLAEGSKEWTDPKTNEKQKKPLYDGTLFHRVIKGFMVQGGDPLGLGTGGPGYKFQDEVWSDVRFSKPGMLAMANGGPATNGSQFFVTTGMPNHLNMRHTIFGECDLETVLKISEVEVGPNDRPTKDVVLQKVVISREGAGAAATPPTPPADGAKAEPKK